MEVRPEVHVPDRIQRTTLRLVLLAYATSVLITSGLVVWLEVEYRIFDVRHLDAIIRAVHPGDSPCGCMA